MARRPVFMPEPDGHGLVRETLVEFEWHPGFSVAQKQRSIRAHHDAVRHSPQHQRILEVSTKGEEPLGRQLSAFELQKTLPDDGFRTCLEAAFRASKVFLDGDQRTQLSELYRNRDARDVKRIMRPWQSIPLTHFRFGTEEWPLEPKSAFYDWLYVRALCEHDRRDEIQQEITQYDGFTDIEFNPKEIVQLPSSIVRALRGPHQTVSPRQDGDAQCVPQAARRPRLRAHPRRATVTPTPWSTRAGRPPNAARATGSPPSSTRERPTAAGSRRRTRTRRGSRACCPGSTRSP